MDKTLTKATFVVRAQQVIHQTRKKRNHTCILLNTFNRINAHQKNKFIEN